MEILSASCRQAVNLVQARCAYASCCMPHEWERGHHVVADAATVAAASPAARSAMFALHRKLVGRRDPLVVSRDDETAAVFAGLECSPADTIHAVPIIHRTGRLWGELVVIAACSDTTVLGELARLAIGALENAQRLAFARRDQDRLLLLAEATDDALYEWDFETREFWWGGGIVKLCGSDADLVETTPRWKRDRIHPDDVERVQTSLDAACAGKAMRWHAEYRFRRHDNSYIVVEDRAYFLRDAGGRAYRMIGSMRDVSAMKHVLAREQEARAEAERANRAKDDFLAMLGHELRNPLAPIVTGLELVQMRGLDVSRDLPVLQRQAQHLIRLVDDLLDVSRIAHGKVELKKERFEIAEVIAAAVETASPLVEARLHHLELEVPSSGLAVIGDRARLAQALANLLTNAAKYTEPNGRIAVAARRVDHAVEIVVRDNGIGIDPAMLPNIFHLFVQERQALDRSQGGLGLGLSIVRSLIELHGGTVVPHSAGRGQGSRFVVRLPMATDIADAACEPVAPSPSRPVATKPVRRKIMIVDDNEDAADLLAMLLERLGNTTRVANDPMRALEIAADFAPDLAVLDIGLPMMDGYELARRLRERPDGSELRLVALTGYGQAADRERAHAAGFDAHLIKPITLDALQTVIARLHPVTDRDHSLAAG